MKKFFADFKKFITRGNIVDLAVAVVVGGAFGKIVTSLVNDIIMPLISLIVGGASVADWKWVIRPAEIDELGTVIKAESALTYGNFLQTIIDFLIIAFFVFLAIRILMNAQKSFDELTDKDKVKDRIRIRKLRKEEGKTKAEAKAILAAEKAEAKAQAEAEAKAKEEAAKALEPPTTNELLGEIRDLLAAQQGKAKKQPAKEPAETDPANE